MGLVLYNTAERRKQEFAPLKAGRVGMYVCGPTVYSEAHIGNARPVIVFDVLYRLLRREHGVANVKYVRNITDVDDKIIAAAAESGEPIDELTTRTTRIYHEDMAALGALPPDEEPRATAHIKEMLALVEDLIAKGNAYEGKGEGKGHVLFEVSSMADYGALSGHNRDELIAGARVEVASYKRDPADFVLWKPSSDDQPGWDSPWGRGRPGWHLECSAMSEIYLGRTFDIHGGGQDLIFPHHENERAQSTCAHGQGSFAQFWMHNAYLIVEGEKMSKSLGNIRTVRELLAEAPGEAIRLNMLSTHYRQPLDWTAEGLTRARTNLDRLYTALGRLSDVAVDVGPDDVPAVVLAALEDDLNTPQALTEIYALAGVANKAEGEADQAAAKAALLAAGDLLGLLQQDPGSWLKDAREGEISSEEIEALIEQRGAARAQKNFAEADRIGDLLKVHVDLFDGSDPMATGWRRKR